MSVDREARDLQLRDPSEGTTLSPLNPRARIQTIVEDDLRLQAGDFSIWSRLGDEMYTGRHLIIRRPLEGNWVTFQTAPSLRSIHFLLPTHEGVPPTTKYSFRRNQTIRPTNTKLQHTIDNRSRHQPTASRRRLNDRRECQFRRPKFHRNDYINNPTTFTTTPTSASTNF